MHGSMNASTIRAVRFVTLNSPFVRCVGFKWLTVTLCNILLVSVHSSVIFVEYLLDSIQCLFMSAHWSLSNAFCVKCESRLDGLASTSMEQVKDCNETCKWMFTQSFDCITGHCLRENCQFSVCCVGTQKPFNWERLTLHYNIKRWTFMEMSLSPVNRCFFSPHCVCVSNGIFVLFNRWEFVENNWQFRWNAFFISILNVG